ncbi:hypothetical protein DFH09DRAFT_1067586 [Mycena vulgaris]|nr:hypothetical protein DFH09DRAFT_1067586 [Mycena vulgaris]
MGSREKLEVPFRDGKTVLELISYTMAIRIVHLSAGYPPGAQRGAHNFVNRPKFLAKPIFSWKNSGTIGFEPTYYFPNGGLGACPPYLSLGNNDLIVALGSGHWNGGSHCGGTMTVTSYDIETASSARADLSRLGLETLHNLDELSMLGFSFYSPQTPGANNIRVRRLYLHFSGFSDHAIEGPGLRCSFLLMFDSQALHILELGFHEAVKVHLASTEPNPKPAGTPHGSGLSRTGASSRN